MSQTITVEQLTKIDIQPGEVLLIQVDCGKMPPSKRQAHYQQVVDIAKLALPNVKVLVGDINMKFSVIKASDSSMSVSASPVSDPLQDYDRAMKGM